MMIDLKTHFQPILAQQPNPLVFLTVSGAHLYGFPSPDSDYDLRGMHLAPLRKVLAVDDLDPTVNKTTVLNGIEIDISTHDARKYFDLLLRKSGNALEQIFSPLVVVTGAEHEALKAIAPSCITKHFVHHYVGMAKNQWGLFEKEHPRRVKPLLYVYRCLLTGIHLMRTGEVEANLANLNTIYALPYVPDLIARKTGSVEQITLDDADMAFHQREYLRLRAVLDDAFAKTHLPDDPPGKQALDELLIDIRFAQFWREAQVKGRAHV